MDGICSQAGSNPLRQIALHLDAKGKTDGSGYAKTTDLKLGEGLRTKPETKPDEIHAFVQSTPSLPEIDLTQPLLKSDRVEFSKPDPVASSAEASKNQFTSDTARTRLRMILQQIDPTADRTIPLHRTPYHALASQIASYAHYTAEMYDAEMEAMYRAEREKLAFTQRVAIDPLTKPSSEHDIRRMQRLNEAYTTPESTNRRFPIFDHLLTPSEGAFDPKSLTWYQKQLVNMSVSDLEKLLTDERLLNRHESNCLEHLSSICGMANFQLGLRGPDSEQCQRFRDAWLTHPVVWRKADAGWQVIRHTASLPEAREMFAEILKLPDIPWAQVAFTCHHFAMRKDTPLMEKIQYFFMSASFHKNAERIGRQYLELQKLEQTAVQRYITERSRDSSLSAIEKERFTAYFSPAPSSNV